MAVESDSSLKRIPVREWCECEARGCAWARLSRAGQKFGLDAGESEEVVFRVRVRGRRNVARLPTTRFFLIRYVLGLDASHEVRAEIGRRPRSLLCYRILTLSQLQLRDTLQNAWMYRNSRLDLQNSHRRRRTIRKKKKKKKRDTVLLSKLVVCSLEKLAILSFVSSSLTIRYNLRYRIILHGRKIDYYVFLSLRFFFFFWFFFFVFFIILYPLPVCIRVTFICVCVSYVCTCVYIISCMNVCVCTCSRVCRLCTDFTVVFTRLIDFFF